MGEGLMVDGRALEGEAGEIISMLMEVLPSHVALIDLDEKRSHQRMSTGWFSHDAPANGLAATVIHLTHEGGGVFMRINRRWILRVVGQGRRESDNGWIVTFTAAAAFSVEQVALVERAAQLLARFLPATSRSSDVPSPDGDSGSGTGGAELGIPVWWARKARN